MPRQAQQRQVALSIIPSSENQVRMIRGVLAYAREHPDFKILAETAIPYVPPERLAHHSHDGVIAYAETDEECRWLADRGVPAVNVTMHQPPQAHLPVVHSDNRALGRQAAEHLLGLGLRTFAFVGHESWHHNQLRQAGFSEAVRASGFSCQQIGILFPASGTSLVPVRPIDRQHLQAALATLQPPVGIMAAHDEFAFEVIEACAALGWTVPHDVAVLGVNNYSLVCEVADPPLSSLVQRSEAIGYEAAALLDRLMAGEQPPPEPILLPPGQLIVRMSTDFLAVSDRMVLDAVRFIQAHCHQPIRTEDVLLHVGVSRRALDKRFGRSLGQSVAEVIRTTRVQRAKELLATSSLDIFDIGIRCGFDSKSGFTRAFRQVAGQLPSSFRRQARQRLEFSEPHPRRKKRSCS